MLERRAVAPFGRAEQLEEARSDRIVETEVVDLMRVLVLDDAPRELPGVEQVGVQPDLAAGRERVRSANDVDGDLRRNRVPVERARVQRR